MPLTYAFKEGEKGKDRVGENKANGKGTCVLSKVDCFYIQIFQTVSMV